MFSILQTNICFNFLINFNFIVFSELSVKISLKEKIFYGISVKLLSLTSPLIPWTPTKHPISINFFLDKVILFFFILFFGFLLGFCRRCIFLATSCWSFLPQMPLFRYFLLELLQQVHLLCYFLCWSFCRRCPSLVASSAGASAQVHLL